MKKQLKNNKFLCPSCEHHYVDPCRLFEYKCMARFHVPYNLNVYECEDYKKKADKE